MKYKERYERLGVLHKEITGMRDLLKKDDRDFTAEEEAKWAAVNADYDKVEQSIERDKRVTELGQRQAERAADIAGRENSQGGKQETGEAKEDDEIRSFRYWLGDRDEENTAAFKRSGLTIERDGNHNELVIDMNDTRRLRHNTREFRAQSVGIDTAGGYLIPEGFVPNLERTLLAFGGMREVSETMRTATGNNLPWPGSDDTSNKGALLSENPDSLPEQDATFTQQIWYAFKYTSKMVKVSSELLTDSFFDLPSLLGEMLGERLARITNEHYTTGTATNRPEGIVVGSTLGFTSVESATQVTADELIEHEHTIDPAYRVGASWMFNDGSLLKIRKLKDGDGTYLWQPNFQAGVAAMLLGYPYRINQDMPAMTSALKPILFGQLRSYKIRDVAQIRMRRLVELFAGSDQEAFVAFLRTDGKLLDAGTHPVKHLLMK